ncbi:hypothetical protein SDC9_141316 [bioreactor metagenome]|uniref:Uncharacterized protein n=1 Tax=bioreactor metagenome TaxID=1076179 RepID=A0A645DXX9_9ZZZZ
MRGAGIQVIDLGFFNNITTIHYNNALSQAGDDTQIMGDPNNGHAQFIAQAFNQVGDLSLNGHVKSGGGFICNKDLGVTRKRHGDHDALAHTARELMGIIVEAFTSSRNTDHLK